MSLALGIDLYEFELFGNDPAVTALAYAAILDRML
jgi:hypothetical protein